MPTSKQQAAINVAKQIDALRRNMAKQSPEIAQVINQAIAEELANQAAGLNPSVLLSQRYTGLGSFGDTSSVIDLTSDPLQFTIPPDLTAGLPDFTSPTDLVNNTPSVSIGSSSNTFLGMDMGALSNLFGNAGSGATPALSDTGIASNPQSVSGILNSITNTVNSTIKAIYTPQLTMAQLQGQLGIIQAQSQAAQLGVAQQTAFANEVKGLLPIALIGGLAIMALKAFNTTRTENFKHRRND